ncbi:MAG: acyl-CoA dehydrogenase [Novosphingobium sp.]|nr:acyl-CoA dehydrogenase [Novosphingobium sp.]
MDFELTPDHVTLLDALEGLVKPFTTAPIGEVPFALGNEELEAALVEGGFLEIAREPEFGLVGAMLVVERVAQLPFAVEAANSAFVGPLLGEGVARPVCVAEADRLWQPIRFLRDGATLVILDNQGGASTLTPATGTVSADPESLFAYPMGLVSADEAARALPAPHLDGRDLRMRANLALASEATGLLRAALQSTIEHVSERKQFGRPLATFQALRHRLAEIHVRTDSLYWMTLRAAGLGDPGEAALAALHAQESARIAVYDFHQMLGAMGMTLEHPLHFWTYRLKALTGEYGGRGRQAMTAARLLWPEACAV